MGTLAHQDAPFAAVEGHLRRRLGCRLTRFPRISPGFRSLASATRGQVARSSSNIGLIGLLGLNQARPDEIGSMPRR